MKGNYIELTLEEYNAIMESRIKISPVKDKFGNVKPGYFPTTVNTKTKLLNKETIKEELRKILSLEIGTTKSQLINQLAYDTGLKVSTIKKILSVLAGLGIGTAVALGAKKIYEKMNKKKNGEESEEE